MSATFHAFGKNIVDGIPKIKLNGTDGEKEMPIMIADHSVIYLPMENNNHYVVFNGASISNKLKGIKDNTAIKSILTNNKFKKIDNDLRIKILELIKNEALDNNQKKLFSYKKELDEDVTTWPAKWQENFEHHWHENNSVKHDDDDGYKNQYEKFIGNMLLEIKKAIGQIMEDEELKELLKKNNGFEDLKKLSELNIEEKVKALSASKKLKKDYYIFKIPGEFLNTQPFGGFNFTDPSGKSDIYSTVENFNKHIVDTFTGFNNKNVHGCEIRSNVEEEKNVWGIDSFKPLEINHIEEDKYDVQGFHLPSGNSVEDNIGLLNDVWNANADKGIILGDSNINPEGDGLKQLQQFANNNNVNILISNFEIRKSRQGGPFFNMQIFKSELQSKPEIDGMMIVYEDTLEDIDMDKLNDLIGTGYYKLIEGKEPIASSVSLSGESLTRRSTDVGSTDVGSTGVGSTGIRTSGVSLEGVTNEETDVDFPSIITEDERVGIKSLADRRKMFENIETSIPTGTPEMIDLTKGGKRNLRRLRSRKGGRRKITKKGGRRKMTKKGGRRKMSKKGGRRNVKNSSRKRKISRK